MYQVGTICRTKWKTNIFIVSVSVHIQRYNARTSPANLISLLLIVFCICHPMTMYLVID